MYPKTKLIKLESCALTTYYNLQFLSLDYYSVANSLLSQELKLCFSDTKFTKKYQILNIF